MSTIVGTINNHKVVVELTMEHRFIVNCIKKLVNSTSCHTEEQLSDYKDLRRQQFVIEEQIEQMFAN
jgi:hypothetical protein